MPNQQHCTTSYCASKLQDVSCVCMRDTKSGEERERERKVHGGVVSPVMLLQKMQREARGVWSVLYVDVVCTLQSSSSLVLKSENHYSDHHLSHCPTRYHRQGTYQTINEEIIKQSSLDNFLEWLCIYQLP